MLEKALESIAQAIEHHGAALDRLAAALEKREEQRAAALSAGVSALIAETKKALATPAECAETVQPAKKTRAAKASKSAETKSAEPVVETPVESAPEAKAEQAAEEKIAESEPAEVKAKAAEPAVAEADTPVETPVEKSAEAAAPAPTYELPEGVGVEEAKRRIYKALAEALKFAAANAPKRSDQLREFCIKWDCRNPMKMPDENVAAVFTLLRTELKLEP